MFGIPIFGTMAHSFIQVHDDEEQAFKHFAETRPQGLVLLIDTYDTEAAAAKIVRLAPRLREAGIALRGVRIDSGDLADHARRVRGILDAGGLTAVEIMASGGLDEKRIRRLGQMAAPIDGYGVGTSLSTSSDLPALDCAYKLQEYAGVARRKLSEGKATWPGRKAVWRRVDADGRFIGDLITVAGAPQPGESLLRPAMRAGRRLDGLPSLAEARSHAAQQLRCLPAPLAALETYAYPVEIGAALRELAAACDRSRAR
jgi:nicotinate phosphoribosyltransferase